MAYRDDVWHERAARVKGITEKNKPNDPVSKQIDNLDYSDDVCNWKFFFGS